jgi:tetratricopeptide (TPR) repeat protein
MTLMLRADSLMNQHTDSALSILRGIENDVPAMNEKAKMHYWMSRTNAENKTCLPLKNEAQMKAVVNYYDAHGNANEKVTAHYLLGCVYRDLKDVPKAIACYNTALNYADTTSADCNYERLDGVYSQLADLYDNLNLIPNEISAFRMAERCAWKDKDTIEALNAQSHIANAYITIGKHHLALRIKEKVIRGYLQQGDTADAAKAMGPSIESLIALGQYQKAARYIKEHETKSGYFDRQGNIGEGHEVFYRFKGKYFEAIHQLDSAEYYFRKEIRTGKNAESEDDGLYGLSRVLAEKHQGEEAARCAIRSYEIDDSLYYIKTSKNYQQMQAMYNYSRQQQKAEQSRQEARAARQRELTALIILGFALLVMGWGAAIILLQRKKRLAQLLKIKSLNELLTTTQEQMEEEKTVMEQKKAELLRQNEHVKEMVGEKDEKLRSLSQQQAQAQERIQQLQQEIAEREKRMGTLADEAGGYRQQLQKMGKEVPAPLQSTHIYHRFDYLSTHVKESATLEDWTELSNTIEQHVPGFHAFINRNKVLKSSEVHVCLLIRLGLKAQGIKICTRYKDSAYTNLRIRLQQTIFGVDDKAAEFDKRIRKASLQLSPKGGERAKSI